MRWLEKRRKLDALIEKKCQIKTKNERPLNSTQVWFMIGLLIALFSAVGLLLTNGIWWSMLIAPIYSMIMLFLFYKQILTKPKQ